MSKSRRLSNKSAHVALTKAEYEQVKLASQKLNVKPCQYIRDRVLAHRARVQDEAAERYCEELQTA